VHISPFQQQTINPVSIYSEGFKGEYFIFQAVDSTFWIFNYIMTHLHF